MITFHIFCWVIAEKLCLLIVSQDGKVNHFHCHADGMYTSSLNKKKNAISIIHIK